MPQVPADDVLEKMPAAEVQQKYPRYWGDCEDCGQEVILYGSYTHYLAGDW